MLLIPILDTILEDKSKDDNKCWWDLKGKVYSNETIQQVSVPSSSTKSPQCDVVFTQRHNMVRHIRYKHEGVRYPCSKCDYKATTQSNLKTHIESIYEGLKYPCSHCDVKVTDPSHLRRHMKRTHKLWGKIS